MDTVGNRRTVSQLEDAVNSRSRSASAIFAEIQALLFTAMLLPEERIRLLRQLAVIYEEAYRDFEAATNTLGDAYNLAISNCVSEQQLQVGCELVRVHRLSGEPLAQERANAVAHELEVLCGTMQRAIATARKLFS